MKFKTETSVYELRKDPKTNELVLTKKKIRWLKSSEVPKDSEFRGTRIEIDHDGFLTLFEGQRRVISTSRLQDL